MSGYSNEATSISTKGDWKQKYAPLTSLFIVCLLILYPAASISAKALQSWEETTERLPYTIGGILVLLIGSCYYLKQFRSHGPSLSYYAPWYFLAIGILCEILVPSEAHNLHEIALGIVIASSFVGLLLTMMRFYGLLLLVPIFLVFMLIAYIRYAFGIEIDAYVVSQILGASPQDIEQFSTIENKVILIVLIISVSAIFTFLAWKCKVKRRIAFSILCASFIISASLIAAAGYFNPISPNADKGIGCVSTLFRLHRAYILAQTRNSILLQKVRNLGSPADKPSSIKTLHGEEGAIVIMHIGESVRADHLSINGYERETTPWLKSREDIINFQNCTAASMSTTASSLAILTNARGNMVGSPDQELEASTGCIMDLFAVNGFTCYAYFNSANYDRNETSGAIFETLQAVYTAKAKKVYEIGEEHKYMPKAQLPQIWETLKNSIGNRFLLINNVGSHIPFNNYDAEHAPFQPANGPAVGKRPQNNPKTADLVRNAYDNTIAYTDEYIQELLDSLKGIPYIYIYISDHGEPLGDNGFWTRANNAFRTFHATQWSKVPFIILYSPEFENLHPHFKEALANLRKNRSLATAHENIFHTLLGIFDIQTPYYDSALDLSSPNPTPYQGPSCDRNGKSLDNLKWE